MRLRTSRLAPRRVPVARCSARAAGGDVEAVVDVPAALGETLQALLPLIERLGGGLSRVGHSEDPVTETPQWRIEAETRREIGVGSGAVHVLTARREDVKVIAR